VQTRPFTLVLAGGGARGYAHVGVLRALEHFGYRPAGLVGVSMGAITAVTYALREDWYEALLSLDVVGAATSGDADGVPAKRRLRVRRAWQNVRTAWSLLKGWGAPADAVAAGRETLASMIGPGRLEEGRLPVTVCATDLLSGARVELDAGPAVPAVLASSALAGVFPPVEIDGHVLADGVYTDIAPVDVARRMGPPVVITVDPTQPVDADSITNGLQAVMRAMEICHQTHAHLRIEAADLVLRPVFDRFVDVLDFDARRMCVCAGARSVRSARAEIGALVGPPPQVP